MPRPSRPLSMLSLVVSFASSTLVGCAADGAPIEGDLVVREAGLAAPVPVGTECHLRLRPAWRQGVNCQALVTCDAPEGSERPTVDLFGGTRVGGYARCETADHAFLRALDDDRLDGDPAIDLDLSAGTLAWHDRQPGATLSLALVGATRPTVWDEE